MKVAILSESSADEAALRVVVDALLGHATSPVTFSLRSRGWPSVCQAIPGTIKHLHYQTDADALVVVADANHSPIHDAPPDEACSQPRQCRWCRMRDAAERGIRELRPVTGRPRIHVAVGLVVPAIEAWFLCGP